MRAKATLYRVLTGPDDAAFCHRVTAALADGWVLYGGPQLTFDAAKGLVVCGQALTKDIDRPYDPAKDLAAQ